MHVILLILKIIGIALLVILGILVTLTVLVLFSPVRYRFLAVFPEKKITARFRWLAGIVSLSIWYPDSGRSYSFRIFGIPFNRLAGRFLKNTGGDAATESSDAEESSDVEDCSDATESRNADKQSIMDKQSNTEGQEVPGESIEQEEYDNKSIRKSDSPKEKTEDKDTKKIKGKASDIHHKIKRVKAGIKKVFLALRDQDNMVAAKVIKDRIILLLKYLKPKKIYANMIIGTGDPCNTGLLFGGISILMGLWPGDYTFVPDFDNKVIEGKAYCKGRIRVSVLLYHVIKLLLDDTVKKAWKHTSKGIRRKAGNGGNR